MEESGKAFSVEQAYAIPVGKIKLHYFERPAS
jgi:hypothetical protein